MTAPPVLLPTWTLADRLRKIRRDVLRIEQRDMADRLGMGAQAYSAWESGRSRPRDVVAVARRIEMLTGVPAGWTLGLDEADSRAADAMRIKSS